MKSLSNTQGEIIKFLHDNERGKDGFIKSGDDEYYFSASPNYHLTPDLTVEKKIVFKVLPATDGKKEQTRILKLIE